MANPKVCVVGASNLDLISFVPRMPRMGETLHGTRFHMGFGGKGANQAVMAAKLGAEVTLVAKVGRDTFGENMVQNFRSQGIDTRRVLSTPDAFTGVAPIAVDPEGHNAIIVVTGANDLLTPQEVQTWRADIGACKVVVCQLESPLETTLAALRIAREQGVFTILNPAPGRAQLAEEFYRLSDIFCPNETEAEMLSGLPATTLDQATAAGRLFLQRGARNVIVTLGERGSLLVTGSGASYVPAERVTAVDTTGAGDAFVGSLAYFVAEGKPLEDAVRRANRIAAISVQSVGTQSSFPSRESLPPDLLA